jgi:hypothetical protein
MQALGLGEIGAGPTRGGGRSGQEESPRGASPGMPRSRMEGPSAGGSLPSGRRRPPRRKTAGTEKRAVPKRTAPVPAGGISLTRLSAIRTEGGVDGDAGVAVGLSAATGGRRSLDLLEVRRDEVLYGLTAEIQLPHFLLHGISLVERCRAPAGTLAARPSPTAAGLSVLVRAGQGIRVRPCPGPPALLFWRAFRGTASSRQM